MSWKYDNVAKQTQKKRAFNIFSHGKFVYVQSYKNYCHLTLFLGDFWENTNKGEIQHIDSVHVLHDW